MDHLAGQGFTSIGGHADDEDAFAFATHHGFEQIDAQVEQVRTLEPDEPPPPPYPGVDFATIEARPELLQRAFALARQGYADMPLLHHGFDPSDDAPHAPLTPGKGAPRCAAAPRIAHGSRNGSATAGPTRDNPGPADAAGPDTACQGPMAIDAQEEVDRESVSIRSTERVRATRRAATSGATGRPGSRVDPWTMRPGRPPRKDPT